MTARAKAKKRDVFQSLQPKDWDHFELVRILRSWGKKKVLVIGDVGVDRYTIGRVERISPEAPVPIVLVEEERLKLGLAANVADNVSVLGGVPLLIGVVGGDRAAQDFRAILHEAGISHLHLVADRSRRTVLKERLVSDRQQLLRVDYESQHGLDEATSRLVFKKFTSLLKQADAVILEDYSKGLLSAELANEIFKAAKRAGKSVSVDPNAKTPLDDYFGASVLTPNTKEAEALAGMAIRPFAEDGGESLMLVGRKILKETSANHVVITRGKEGMAIFSADNSKIRLIPTYAREVYDVSGAGDTVISVLTLALASGATIEQACVLGNLAAGVEVAKRGTATVTIDEIRVALEFFGSMNLAELAE